MAFSSSIRPLSQSRAEYWLGRAAERAGNRNAAVAHYKNAGKFPTTYYGQLALSRIGVKQLPIAPAPRIDAAAKKRFASHELVQVMNKLDDLNRGDRNTMFMRALAERLTDPKRYGVDLVMPAFYAAMLVPAWKGPRRAIPWLVSGVVALAVHWLAQGWWFIIAGALAGSLAAALMDGPEPKRP